jgi:putative PIN family toxin of toxin-antitoxin system
LIVRLVLDTNIIIAALLWKGAPHQLFSFVAEGRARCFSSAGLIGELARSLQYPKFAQRLSEQHLTPEALVERYTRLTKLVAPADISPTVLADPDDDHVLACALAAQADLIVSGDPDLLNTQSVSRHPYRHRRRGVEPSVRALNGTAWGVAGSR